ncbi:hypothetical protein DRJ17_01005 [Candidatus Woesearchaeota archaeon]|nr:MAG: hypothetical protein DRJ17_01005 [Candidatus Woesearchaeota archaeon]
MLKKKTKKTVPVSELEKLKRWYAEELKRRDQLIDELREKNRILIQTALKSRIEQLSKVKKEKKDEK